MNSIWFTSDLHFFHSNVIKYCNRPFYNVEQMNEELIARWNSKVQANDIVYCLGDLSLAFRPIELFSNRLNGLKHLVPGNHDFCHSYHKRSRKSENQQKWKHAYQEHGWIICPEITEIKLAELGNIVLCHLPYSDGEAVDKYANWRPKDNGRLLLCGHVHEKWKIKQSTKGTSMINVGVDVWDWYPVNLSEIAEMSADTQE